MARPQIFNESFEQTWEEFDKVFRSTLLTRIKELGSLYRIDLDHEELNRELGLRFYEALETTFSQNQHAILRRFRAAVAIEMPKAYDELSYILSTHRVYPLHAFYLLLIYIQEHPLRAFFSGADQRLPFNTLTLQVHQKLSDPLPTDLGYELESINVERCPYLAYDTPGDVPAAAAAAKPSKHPQHHWTDLRWVWHFGVADTGGLASPT